ncbi:cell division protein ZipA [Colwellia chukchiensis]|uniref:Cell division protein ZipA n=1 Tax=Colwellia chukchiensis TaxID=641665 RepID=A0A1H7TFH3_9GAMM|nr:cell division protein ZipA [Colwellia chukchiensis]SEL83630.1 cell division protein ZipA [Colwellia chukchiensis]
MEDNIRNTLIIISALVIAAIFIHGYWTIRKQKNPYKLKAKEEPITPEPRGFDGSGFDQDGVSKVKVIGINPQHEEVLTNSSNVDENSLTSQARGTADAQLDKQVHQQGLNFGALLNDDDTVPEHLKQQALSDADNDDAAVTTQQAKVTKSSTDANSAQTKSSKPAAKTEPVYQQPVTQAKPDLRKANDRQAAVKRKQMEIDFEEQAIKDMPTMSATANEQQEVTEPEQQVLVLSVVMPEGLTISGAALLPSLLTLGMKYGDMNIFHRHQDNAGNGKVTFSLANIRNPGTFDLDDIENFSTQGVTLFMTLPNAGDAFEVFEQMLNAAKQLAVEFGGQLLDDKRSVMTKQTEQHYMGRIREFERKNRISSF